MLSSFFIVLPRVRIIRVGVVTRHSMIYWHCIRIHRVCGVSRIICRLVVRRLRVIRVVVIVIVRVVGRWGVVLARVLVWLLIAAVRVVLRIIVICVVV